MIVVNDNKYIFIRFFYVLVFKKLIFFDVRKNDFYVEMFQSSNNCLLRFVLYVDKYFYFLGRGVDIFYVQVFVL